MAIYKLSFVLQKEHYNHFSLKDKIYNQIPTLTTSNGVEAMALPKLAQTLELQQKNPITCILRNCIGDLTYIKWLETWSPKLFIK